MANLSGQNIGTNYKGILNLNTLNGNLSGTLQAVTDGDGNASPLQLSTTQVAVNASVASLAVFHTIKNSTGFGWQFAQIDANYLGLYSTNVTPNATNYSFRTNTTQTGINATNHIFLGISENAMLTVSTNGVYVGGFNTSPSARLHVRGDGTNPIIIGDLADGIFRFRVTDNRIFSGGSTNLGLGGFELLNGDNSTTIFRLTRNQEAGLVVQSLANISFSLGNAFSASAYHVNFTRTAGGHILQTLTGTNVTSSWYTGDGSSNTGWIGTESNHSFGILTNNAYRLIVSNTGLLQLGGTTSGFPAIRKGTGAVLEFVTADGLGFCGITAGRSTEKTIEVLEVGGAMGLGFFNTAATNQPTTSISEATYISSGGGGSQIRTGDTIGGYTLQQVVQALQDLGLLA
jgi:hypothetical protein